MWYKKSRNQCRKWFLLAVMVMSMNWLFVNHVSGNQAQQSSQKQTVNPLGLTFNAEEEDDIKLSLVPVSSEKPDAQNDSYKLETYIQNTGNILTITGAESVAAEELLSGQKMIRIDYRIETTDYKNELLQINEGESALGTIAFHRTLKKQDPFWRISNSNGSWGIGMTELETPDLIYKLFPKYIRTLRGSNHIISYEKGVIIGYVIIQMIEPIEYKIPEITLDELQLPQYVNKKVTANSVAISKIEMIANYKFNLPLYWKHSGSNDESEYMSVQIKLPMRFYVDVINMSLETQ